MLAAEMHFMHSKYLRDQYADTIKHEHYNNHTAHRELNQLA
jgi:hypothetical protein